MFHPGDERFMDKLLSMVENKKPTDFKITVEFDWNVVKHLTSNIKPILSTFDERAWLCFFRFYGRV